MQSISERVYKRREEDKIFRIFWEKTAQGARVLRIFGQTPVVTVPDEIEGLAVTEIGDYCFSKTARLPAAGFFVSDGLGDGRMRQANLKERDCQQAEGITELCGGFAESVSLPDSVVKIGSYAFYNCRNLAKLELGGRIKAIGSDAFMNCYKLKKLIFRCSAFQPTCLQKMLVQISWDVEVFFNARGEQAALFYPEYYEAYDEIAPAHIFERRITGEGFRARQCFLNHLVDYEKYDAVFLQSACAETKQAMCHLALCRLRYPVCLPPQAEMFYRDYIYENSVELAGRLVRERERDMLEFLFCQKLLSQEAVNGALFWAVEAGWTEGSAFLLQWQQVEAGKSVEERYAFE